MTDLKQNSDEEMQAVSSTIAWDLQQKVNEVLKEGGWRVVAVKMPLGQFERYEALLVRSSTPKLPRG